MTFALDTNTLIYFFRGDGRVAEHLLATPPGQVAVPAIVLSELETGIAKSSDPRKRREQLDRLLAVVRTLVFGLPEAKVAGRIRAALEAAGTPIGPLDVLIAATALANNATLVTRNEKEFSRVSGLSITNWYD